MSNDVLGYLEVVAPLKALRVLRLLEKRCATVGVSKMRLACAHRLLYTPYNCTAGQILGSPDSITRLFLWPTIGVEFCDAIACGALPLLTALSLNVRDAGMTAFCTAIGSGALPNLQVLWISPPSQQLKDVCSTRRIRIS